MRQDVFSCVQVKRDGDGMFSIRMSERELRALNTLFGNASHHDIMVCSSGNLSPNDAELIYGMYRPISDAIKKARQDDSL